MFGGSSLSGSSCATSSTEALSFGLSRCNIESANADFERLWLQLFEQSVIQGLRRAAKSIDTSLVSVPTLYLGLYRASRSSMTSSINPINKAIDYYVVVRHCSRGTRAYGADLRPLPTRQRFFKVHRSYLLLCKLYPMKKTVVSS